MSGAPETLPVRTLLQQIQAKVVPPASLDAETRQDVVELLSAEGYPQSAIAQILERSDRTIRRDLRAIRERNALSPSPELARELVGQLVAAAERHAAALTRLAREPNTSVSERAQCEYLAWKVCNDYFQRLQSAGYLPNAPTAVVADLTVHGSAAFPSRDHMQEQLSHMLMLTEAPGEDMTDVKAECLRLQQEIERVCMAEQIASLRDALSVTEEADGTDSTSSGV